MKRYCPNLFNYHRRPTLSFRIGSHLPLGGDSPIVIQSMTTTPTADVDKSSRQVLEIADAGAQMVRLTAQGRTEAERLLTIRRRIEEQGCYIPLVADIHFNAALALIAAQYVSKVRINPGNFVERSAAHTNVHSYDQHQWDEECERLSSELINLIGVCRQYNTALRIGVNHGSLSARMVSKWGDTPHGMVESAMEFLRICQKERFDKVVVSMKSSNPRVMVEAYRMLVAQMNSEDMHYPLHLGVTEAGEGADGRIRSAVGIGSLLCDGIGDTIRVSLTEPPQNEIEPAKTLVDYFKDRQNHTPIPVSDTPLPYNPYSFSRRESSGAKFKGVRIGARAVPVVVGNPDKDADIDEADVSLVTPQKAMNSPSDSWIAVRLNNLSDKFIEWLANNPNRVVVLFSENTNWVGEMRATIAHMMRSGVSNPLIVSRCYSHNDYEKLQIHAAADFGALLIDGLIDGVWMVNEIYENICSEDAEGQMRCVERNLSPDFDLVRLSLDILQASRARLSRTEIISCPGCGRTLYDLQSAARAVKERFGSYPGLKIAVMGCIVNGPGEMADADFGYVGAGAGKVSLYRGREVVLQNIPQAEALDQLEILIKNSINR